MYSIEYLNRALLEFEEIGEFIAITLNNLNYARKVTNKIKIQIKKLSRSPEICAPYQFKIRNQQYPSPDLYTYRKLVVENYIVLYVVDHKKKKIIIVRIFDGRSDYQNKL